MATKYGVELSVEMVKAVAWPLLVLILVLCFWTSLQSAAELLPNLLSRSETITIAGLSLKISKGLSRQPSEDVKQVLSKLSAEGVRRLLNSSGASSWDVGNRGDGVAENAEIVKLGLAEEVAPEDLQDERGRRRYSYGVRLTPLGKETQGFLFALIAEFTQELGRPNAS